MWFSFCLQITVMGRGRMDERGRILSITFSLFLSFSVSNSLSLSLSLFRFLSLPSISVSVSLCITHFLSPCLYLSHYLNFFSTHLPLSPTLILSFSLFFSVSIYLSLLHCLTFSLFLFSLFDTPGTFDGVPGYVITRIDEVRKQTKLNVLHITHSQSCQS